MTPPEIIRFVSDGFERAKAGNAAEVYAQVTDFHNRGMLERRSHYAYGWIIYYALHQAPAYEIEQRKHMLARYLNLETPRPHKLHSMILTQAIRLHKDAAEQAYIARQKGTTSPSFSIIRFSDLWNLANLREGDWRRKEADGKMMNSTVEKFITCYVNELESSRRPAPPHFKNLMEDARKKYADSASFLSQLATIHELEGDVENAIAHLRAALLSTQSKFFLWSRLAMLVDKEKEIKLHIALLHKAASSPGPEDFKGKIRLALAEAWTSIKAYPQALYELNAMREIYQRNGWHLSARVSELEKMIPAGTVASNPAAAYKRVVPLAEDFIFSAIPEIKVTKNYHKNGGEATDKFGNKRMQPAAWRVSDSEQHNYWLTPTRFGIDDSLPIGTPLAVRIHNGKIVKAKEWAD